MAYEEQVAAGAAYLDQKVPGWEASVNLEKLDMADCKRCIVGQTICEYYTWQNDYDMYDDKSAALGFDVYWPEGYSREWLTEQYVKLEETWVNLLKERANAGT
jgi:hypothetical protein